MLAINWSHLGTNNCYHVNHKYDVQCTDLVNIMIYIINEYMYNYSNFNRDIWQEKVKEELWSKRVDITEVPSKYKAGIRHTSDPQSPDKLFNQARSFE